MDKVNNNLIENRPYSNSNNKMNSGQNYLLKEPIEDRLDIAKKDKNEKENSLSKWIIGGIVVGLGAIAIVFATKKFRGKTQLSEPIKSIPIDINNHPDVIKKRKETQAAIDLLEEQGRELRENTARFVEDSKRIVEYEKGVQARAIEETARTREQIEKESKENAEKIRNAEAEINRMKETFKKSCDDFKNYWERAEAQREKFWNDFHTRFQDRATYSVLALKLKNAAEQGLSIFRKFGKSSDGHIFNEISILDSIDRITLEKLKKAHWRLYKKYGPILNTGTEEEKIEATKIMQQINPANDNIRAYIEIK